MIQLNLLPDVKLEYIKARQRKRMVIGTSVIVSGFFITIFILLFIFVRFAQKEHLSNLDEDISKTTQELKSKEDIDKILTIQNQLNSLPALHDQKTISSRLFDYLTQLTPTQATISEVTLDFSENTLSLEGNADQISTVNKFVDTLKFTGFTTSEEGVSDDQKDCVLQTIDVQGVTNENTKTCRAFSEVVLQEFSLEAEGGSSTQSGKPVSYQIKFKFDPKIFANIKADAGQSAVSLKIPNIISTRSATEKPGALFVPK
ncbi:PilN domain-containing protein [Candidatus Saccharibacteria bacterium]|nr:PilN domain-containing protein [Candidatus Saccharibacteria bacterium]